MSIPEEIRRKLEMYAFGHGGKFEIDSTEDRVRVAVKFHPHSFSLAWMFAEEVFHKSGIEVELRPSLTDRIAEPETEMVAKLFYGEVTQFAEQQGGRFIFERHVGEPTTTPPMKVYADFADEQAAVDWLEEMITMLFVPAIALRWSSLDEAARERILEDGAVLGG
jgi:hypothetical protein